MSSFNETIVINSLQAGVGSVGTTAEALDGSTNNRVHKGVKIKNTHATQNLFVGKSGVTSSTGYELGPNEEVFLYLRFPDEIFVVGSGAATTYTWIGH